MNLFSVWVVVLSGVFFILKKIFLFVISDKHPTCVWVFCFFLLLYCSFSVLLFLFKYQDYLQHCLLRKLILTLFLFAGRFENLIEA